MLESFKYVNHLNEEILFGEDGILVSTNDLRDFEWSYNTQFNKISNFYRKSTKKTVPFTVYGGPEKANRMFELFEKDVLNNTPGKLYIGDYYIKVYIFASRKTKYLQGIIKGTLEIITVQDMWVKPVQYIYRHHDEELQNGKGYDYDYPYDYASGANIQSLYNTSFVPAPVVITIYGPATNPAIAIAGHEYKVNCTVGSTEYLVIDGYEKEIYTVNNVGVKTNKFQYRSTDTYIFEKVPVGEQKVNTLGSFDYGITLMLERGEPEWI